jgi:hypothetical protein
MTNTETSVRETPGVSGQRLLAALSRVVLMATGMFSVWWGVSTFPIFWHDARLEHTAHSLINGELFKPEVLQNVLADAELEKTWTRPEALNSAAIVRFGLAEQTTRAAESDTAPSLLVDQLEASVRRSLSASPADSFLWLALFLSSRMKADRGKDNFATLRMSYRVGPHEGWVAGRRNAIAFAHFPELPQDLADAAVSEFRDLVVSGYFNTAAKILVGPGWPIHEMLLRRLEDAPIEARRQLSFVANARGYDIAVPGVERPEPRPWR